MGRSSNARERLVEVAIGLFWQQGFYGVSVDQLCSAAKLKKGSFYHFFPSKEELALTAIETHWARRKPFLDAIFSPTIPALERLERYFDLIYQRQCEIKKETGHVLGCLYFSLGSASLTHPRIATCVRNITDTYVRYYESTLREATALGLINVQDPAGKARTVFALMEGILAEARVHNNTECLHRLTATAFELIGLPAPSAKNAPQAKQRRRASAKLSSQESGAVDVDS